MDVVIEDHSPMPPRKFRPTDTLERLKTIVQETLAIPLPDQELWCNGKCGWQRAYRFEYTESGGGGDKRRGLPCISTRDGMWTGIDPIVTLEHCMLKSEL
jgi:hypothetical protein